MIVLDDCRADRSSLRQALLKEGRQREFTKGSFMKGNFLLDHLCRLFCLEKLVTELVELRASLAFQVKEKDQYKWERDEARQELAKLRETLAHIKEDRARSLPDKALTDYNEFGH
jgi:hypothetical protein